MTEPFQPKEEDFPDLRTKLSTLLTVPVKRHPVSVEAYESMEDAPYEILAAKAVLAYPFTREAFKATITALTQELARYLNELGSFESYPMTLPPRNNELVAMVDFRGPAFTFDLRVVMIFEALYNFAEEDEEPQQRPAVKFFLTTLVAKL